MVWFLSAWMSSKLAVQALDWEVTTENLTPVTEDLVIEVMLHVFCSQVLAEETVKLADPENEHCCCPPVESVT